MKIVSKVMLVFLLFFGLSLQSAPNAYSMAQITLQNNTSFWLYLYIDGNFGCGPVMPSGFCVSSVNPGSRLLEARKGGDPGTTIKAEPGVNIGDGTSPTWTVTIEDPDQALLKKINGARYIGQFTSQWMAGEDEAVINGMMLVWRNRVTWATPDVAEAMAKGERGFKRRQIGEWLEFGRMQIVGREARLSSKRGDEIIFTISEDGNSITKNEGGYTSMFYRQ